ncbi:uncharacterized protein [Triticum aestivum]|uniref:uncharacterized protein isoform X1 n=1 Tax=Triticum aestivum TaxID=4565 RepID=UPI001D0152D6|nr:uncharacterized protein LOC123097034 isoform X1 [Triticum aestivum]
MGIKYVPSRYILQRWRKDFKRKHVFIKCSYDDMLNTPVVQHYDELCKRSHEVAEKGAESDELRDLVMDGLDQLERKVDAYRANHAFQVQAEDPTSKHEDKMLKKEKLVLSPIPVRSAGRPRSKRKLSKVDQLIQKLRAKKRQVPTSTTKVQTHKGRKNYVIKSKGGQDANLQSSQQTEGNIHYEGYGARSYWFFPNEFQGKKNAMDLLAANLKE